MTLAWANGQGVAPALNLYNEIRSPHFQKMYHVLDELAAIKPSLLAEKLPVDEKIEERVKRGREKNSSWMYHNEVDKVVQVRLQQASVA
jgi:salicylate hydroxylase